MLFGTIIGGCIEKQDRQCTYNVTLRRFYETIVVVDSNKYSVFLCVSASAFVRVWVWVHGPWRVLARV